MKIGYLEDPLRCRILGNLLLRKVEKTPSGCWLFPTCNKRKYATVKISIGRSRGVHIVSYELANGPIPQGRVVCHTCDVPNCINPDHMFIGTHADNTRDMYRKCRANVWSSDTYRNAKLSWQQVLEIKERIQHGERNSDIAAVFKVDPSTISKIKRGKARIAPGAQGVPSR